jgi:putative transposase
MVQTLYHYREQKKFLLHEFVIMPDHVHLLLTPAKEISLERAVQFIKGGFSFRLQSRLPVWQASFTNHRIRDADDYERHRSYIRENAVRAGLVRTAKDYPFCSAQGTFEIDPPPLTISTECV